MILLYLPPCLPLRSARSWFQLDSAKSAKILHFFDATGWIMGHSHCVCRNSSRSVCFMLGHALTPVGKVLMKACPASHVWHRCNMMGLKSYKNQFSTCSAQPCFPAGVIPAERARERERDREQQKESVRNVNYFITIFNSSQPVWSRMHIYNVHPVSCDNCLPTTAP